MNGDPLKQLFMHPLVLASAAAVVLIAVGSGAYYAIATREPAASTAETSASTTQAITATGTVEPVQNPDLAFDSGGRVVSIRVKVGQSVGQGELLASLDISVLAAQRAQAQATVDAQQAKLAGL